MEIGLKRNLANLKVINLNSGAALVDRCRNGMVNRFRCGGEIIKLVQREI